MMGDNKLQVSDNVSLYYESHGAGTGMPLLLIAGLASDSQSWGSVVQDMARDFLVITPDNRGVGRSTQTGIDINIALMADDCIALLDSMEIAAAHILGHSMGGFVAIDCALRHPDRVSSLMLAGSAGSCSHETSAILRGWAADLSAGTDAAEWFSGIFPWLFTRAFMEDAPAVEAAVRFALDYPYPQCPEAFRKQVEAIADFDRAGQIAAIEIPTLIMHGAGDRLFSARKSIAGLAQIKGARSVVIEQAAHAIHLEQPAAFSSAIRGFLQ